MKLEHIYYTSCGKPDCNGSCVCCTLSVCKVCGLFEGELTTDCPGKPISFEVAQMAYKGKLDYRNGQWVLKLNPTNQVWQEVNQRSIKYKKYYPKGPYYQRTRKRKFYAMLEGKEREQLGCQS